MQPILDFSKGVKKIPTIIQPDFSIAGRSSSVYYYNTSDSFRFAIGCQGLNIDKKVLAELYKALEFKEPKEIEKKVLVRKGSKPTKSSAELAEESDSYYISVGSKLYPKVQYELKTIKFTPEPKYFRKTGTQVRASVGNGGPWYSLTTQDLADIKMIFDKLNDYYHPIVKEKKPTTKKKA